MKRLILILLSSIIIFSVTSAQSGTKVTSSIVPNSFLDNYSTHQAKFGKGGYRSVKTSAERDAIFTSRRDTGMLVFVASEDKIYILKGGIENSNWAELKLGGNVSSDTVAYTRNGVNISPGGYTYAFRSTGTNTNYSVLLNTYDNTGNPVDSRFIKQNNSITVYPAISCKMDALVVLNSFSQGSGGSGGTGAVNSVNGKTGTVMIDKTDLSLENVDNTSDLNKPISTATQTGLNAKIAYGDTLLTGKISSKKFVLDQNATKEPILSGTGFVKKSGYTTSYDNTTYSSLNDTVGGSGAKKLATVKYVADHSASGGITISDSTLGILYNKNSWANTNDFTAAGSVTYSASSNKINISGGSYNPSSTQGTNNSAIGNALKILAYGQTMLEKWKITVKFKINATPSTTSYGLAVGTWSENPWARSHALGYFNMTTNTYGGKSSLILGSSYTTADTSNFKLAISQNDYVTMTVERTENTIKCYVKNNTTGIGSSANYYLYDQINTTILTPNTSSFAIIPCGGTYVIDSISIVSSELKKPDILLVGDSKLSGYSTTFSRRISSVLKSLTGLKVTVSAGPTDLSTQVLNRFSEIKKIKPKLTYLCVGRNDGAIASDTITMKTNLVQLRDSFAMYGLKMYFLDGIYEINYDQTKIQKFIKRTFSNYINILDGGKKSSYVSIDGTHPSFYGSMYVANAINANMRDTSIYYEKKTSPEINFEYNNISFYGILNGLTGSNAVRPSIQNLGDIIIGHQASIRAASYLGTQQNAITLSDGGWMYFKSYYLGTGFAWQGAPVTTGTLATAMQLFPDGKLFLGSPYNGFHQHSGDLIVGYDAGITGVGAPQSGYDARFVPLSSSRYSEFRNYAGVGKFDFYTSGGVDGSQYLAFTINANTSVAIPGTNTALGTTGNQTINKVQGRVNFAAGASSLTVTNSLVTTSSNVFIQVIGSDATAISGRVNVSSGSFVINLNSAATTETQVSFFILN